MDQPPSTESTVDFLSLICHPVEHVKMYKSKPLQIQILKKKTTLFLITETRCTLLKEGSQVKYLLAESISLILFFKVVYD